MENNSAPQKFKWKINLFDIIIILIILAVGAFALWYFYKPADASNASVSADGTVTYIAEFTDLPKNTADLIKSGDLLTDNVQKKTVGTVKSVEVFPFTISTKDYETGNMFDSVVPDKYAAKVTIEAPCTENEKEIQVDGYTVRVGNEISFVGPGYSGVGYIISIER